MLHILHQYIKPSHSCIKPFFLNCQLVVGNLLEIIHMHVCARVHTHTHTLEEASVIQVMDLYQVWTNCSSTAFVFCRCSWPKLFHIQCLMHSFCDDTLSWFRGVWQHFSSNRELWIYSNLVLFDSSLLSLRNMWRMVLLKGVLSLPYMESLDAESLWPVPRYTCMGSAESYLSVRDKLRIHVVCQSKVSSAKVII